MYRETLFFLPALDRPGTPPEMNRDLLPGIQTVRVRPERHMLIPFPVHYVKSITTRRKDVAVKWLRTVYPSSRDKSRQMRRQATPNSECRGLSLAQFGNLVKNLQVMRGHVRAKCKK